MIHIAAYAAQHFEKHHRPLRIAVDEAGWRFNNLTEFQVEQIRQSQPAANPVERTIFFRALRLLKLNIQLLFVFDGASRPWKRGRSGGNKLDYERIKLVCQMLDVLGIAHHRAPGEAEAECAKLQRLGIVDVVWSDDGDTFMFGARTLIQAHKVNGKRVDDYVRIYRMERIEQDHDLNQESLVLFALTAGGDYDTKGLPGCGPKKAAQLAKKSTGLAHSLMRLQKHEFEAWRQALLLVSRIMVPPTYPDQRALGHYCNPKVSSDEQCRNLNGLKRGWLKPIDQVKLRKFAREHFDITTPRYMKHLAPIFLVRALAQEPSDEVRASNLQFAVELKPVRDTQGDPPLETKITFDPIAAIEIDVSRQPLGEDWTLFAAKDGTPYNPHIRVECEILPCLLSNGLPEGSLVVSAKSSKRKRAKASDDAVHPNKSVKTAAHVEAEKTSTPITKPARAKISSVNKSSKIQTDRQPEEPPRFKMPWGLDIFDCGGKAILEDKSPTHYRRAYPCEIAATTLRPSLTSCHLSCQPGSSFEDPQIID